MKKKAPEEFENNSKCITYLEVGSFCLAKVCCTYPTLRRCCVTRPSKISLYNEYVFKGTLIHLQRHWT